MSGNNSIRKKTLTGIFWRFSERIGAQGISFIVSIILARLLAPKDYGLIAMITIFITISNVFVDSGLATALIQKKDADDTDFSTVFYFNIFICLVIYAVLFLAAPIVSKFYAAPELTLVIRVLSLTVVISSLKNVQQAYVFKNMLFRKFFFSTLGGTLISAVVGIWLAYSGFGVWALVAQQLVNTFIDTLILWLTVKWRPKLVFSVYRLKNLVSFGWKLLVSSLINTIYDNIRQLIIGKVYSAEQLAFYNRGMQFPQLVITNINTAIDSVLFPVMSDSQEDIQSVKRMTQQSIRVTSFVLWPLMIGMFVVAEPLIQVLLTDKWLFSVPFMRIFCVAYAFQPINTANLNAIKALGRSDIFLKLEVIKKTIGIAIILITLKYGVIVMAFGLLAYNIIAQIINASPNRKLLSYSYLEQIKDIMPYIGMSIIMGLIIYPISFLPVPNVVVLFLQVISGITIYFLGAIISKDQTLKYIFCLINNFREK